jgi:hypothetical protein
MRDHPIEPDAWEAEAARRREVVREDFGASRRPTGTRTSVLGALAGWIAALTRADSLAETSRVDRQAACEPGFRATNPGS